MHVVCVDIGNSRTKLGLFMVADPVQGFSGLSCLGEWSVTPDELIPFESIGQLMVDPGEACGIVAASDPARIDRVLRAWPSVWPPPIVANNRSMLPLDVRVEFPERVGIDRLLNAIAAAHLRSSPDPVIVIDSGTATTVDLVAADGGFEGGAIFPGVELSAHALHDYTARLPWVTLEELQSEPVLPGKETHAAICAGLLFGQLGAIREIASRLERQLNLDRPITWFLTGGASPLLRSALPEAVWHSNMAMQGLAWTAYLRRDP